MHDPIHHVAAEAPPPRAPAGGRVSGRHPVALSTLDRPYLVPWGRRECIAWSCAMLAISLLLGAAAFWLSPWWAVIYPPILGLWAFTVLFFRNPKRSVPDARGALVAPADGTVWDLEELDEVEFIGGPALRIGIFLSVFNVHTTRAPCDSRVEWLRYRPGRFHDARREAAARENEAQAIGLVVEEEGGRDARLLLRQISGAIARRIVCPLGAGDRLARGGLIGMIKYGSRTELWVPRDAGFELEVAVGQRVRGGSSVLGRFRPPESATDARESERN